MSDIIFCINSILPVFVIIILGYLLYKIGLLTDGFVNVADKLVFKCALPAMLFYNVATTDFNATFNGKLTVFCLAGVLVLFFALMLLVTPSVKHRDVRGAMIQGIFRSNFAILGVPLAANIFGDAGVASASLLTAFIVPVYNVLAVIVLALNMPTGAKKSKLAYFFSILKNIATNPLIISILLAIPFAMSWVSMPTLVGRSVSYLSDLSTPLALLSIGASFRFADLKHSFGYALTATVLKMAVCPVIFCTLGVVFGFRGVDLGMILILFGAPTAVSSYIMAKQMKSNHTVASQIVVLTTLFCSFTMLAATFVLRRLGLI